MTKLIFLGGVHGVGKTTFCKLIADKINYHHETASNLIKSKSSSSIAEYDKGVDNVADNQKLLIEAVSTYKNPNLLLDGHFTLITKKNSIEKIDLQIFRCLSPWLIVILYDDPVKILLRIQSRDNKNENIKLIKQQQSLELQHAKFISNKLNIPILNIKPDQQSIIISYLKKYHDEIVC